MQALQETKAAFDRDGYVLLKGFFSGQEIAELNQRIDHYIATILPKLPTDAAFYEIKDQPESIMRLQGMDQHDPFFKALYADPRCIQLAETLLEDDVRSKNLQWFNKPPGLANQTPPHQDGYYFMIEPNVAVTLWISQDHANQSNGCVRYIPGSHRRGMRPHQSSNVLGFSQGIVNFGAADQRIERALPTEPGDVIAHHSLTIHRADANPSPNRRRALGLVYFANSAQEDQGKAEAYRKTLNEEWIKKGRL
jgi:phytanoyl-CoA hydroxylase